MEAKEHVGGVGKPSDREVPNPRTNLTTKGCEIAPLREERVQSPGRSSPTEVGERKTRKWTPGTRMSGPGEHQHEPQNGGRTKLGEPLPSEMNLHSEWGRRRTEQHGCLLPKGLKPVRLDRKTSPDQAPEESALPPRSQLSEKANFQWKQLVPVENEPK